MSDYKSHGNAPIEFCGDQEGWIAVGSLSDDSPNSPCFPRSVLLGVGLGPAGKMHPSNIAAMLTIAQATDLRTRLTEAMAVDRPAPTPTPAPGLDLDAVERAERAMTPGPWAAKIYTTHVAGTSQETQWHEAIAGGPSSGTVVCETEWSVFEDDEAIGAANIRGIVALRNAAPALIAEVRALRAEVERLRADKAEAKRLGSYLATYLAAWAAANQPPPDHRDTMPPEIEAAIADAGQALVDAWDSAQSGPPHRFAVYTDPEGDPEVAAGWMAMARMHAAAIAAAREAWRREALEGAAGVEEAIADYTEAAIMARPHASGHVLTAAGAHVMAKLGAVTLPAQVAELTAARDRLLAREHEDGRLHAQLRAELAELRARPVLTEDLLRGALDAHGHAGLTRKLFAHLGPFTLPSPDRAEELTAAIYGDSFSELRAADQSSMVRRTQDALAKLSPAPAPTFDAAFLRRVLVATKHGPNGKGGPGPCDAACVKCEAERMAKAAPAREVAPTLVAVSDEELVRVYYTDHEAHDCDNGPDRGDGCCQRAGIRAVRAKLGAAEVTEERLAAALAISIPPANGQRAKTCLELASDAIAYLRATAAKGG